MVKIPVIIVAYYPEERLVRSVENLEQVNQVADIIIVDNTGEACTVIDLLEQHPNVNVIRNPKNEGIAAAQNVGLMLAQEKGYRWALTLDHDTIPDARMFAKYVQYVENNDCADIGILCTDFLDIGIGERSFGNSEPIDVDECISSGSLLNLSVFEKLGRMKEHYFIDQVDNEYCYRLRRYGYRIVALPGVDMEHKMGNITARVVLGKQFYLYNQSPIRTYYRTRNLIYMMREYADDKVLRKKNIKALGKDLIRILFEEKWFEKLKNYLKGVVAGVTTEILS